MKSFYSKLLLLSLLPIILFFNFHGIPQGEEGNIIYYGSKILTGKIPYLDFDYPFTPIPLYLVSAIFKLFGQSVLSYRILISICTFLTSILIYKVVYYSTKNKVYSTFSSLIFIIWEPAILIGGQQFLFSILFTFAYFYLLIRFLISRKNIYLFLGGIFLILVILNKIDVGIASLFSTIIFFSTKSSRKFKNIIIFSYGFAWGVIGFIVYLLINSSFALFLVNFKEYFLNIFLLKMTQSILIFPDKLNLYLLILIPFLISAVSFYLIYYRRRFHLLFVISFVIFLYFFEVSGTGDFYISLFALLGVPLSLLIRFSVTSYVRFLGYLVFALIAFFGFYNFLMPKIPLNSDSVFANSERVKIFIDKKSYYDLEKIDAALNTKQEPKEYFFADYDSTILYFIENIPNPVEKSYYVKRYNGSYPEELIGNLVAKNVKLVIIKNESYINDQIKDFLDSNFTIHQRLNRYTLYIQKDGNN